MLWQIDIYLFRLLNNFAGQNKILDWFFYFCAVYLIFVLVVLTIGLLIYYFKRESNSELIQILQKFKIKKKTLWFLFLSIISPFFAYFLKILISIVYFRPRPFVTLANVHQLLFKSPLNASFPSGHTVLAFALAFSVFYKNKIWGSIFLILAMLIGLGRIFVGIHYPLDIIGGILVAFLATFIVNTITKKHLNL
jgi:undecaprenyl-diphosphatase